MSRLRYGGKGERTSATDSSASDQWWQCASHSRRGRRRPSPATYVADDDLVNAVNVALALEIPLLLSGEPGTGKTELARSIAWELHLEEPLKFETKSTSSARDLFYTYDALGSFHAAHRESRTDREPVDLRSFVTFNALGLAILRTGAEITRLVGTDQGLIGIDHLPPRRSVVLIDEIDKAPRDFPNDVLNEIELLYFRVPEMRNIEVRANPDVGPPIVVITSNSEKELPNAFLRRCAYHHIEFPAKDADGKGSRLREIVERHLGERVAGKSAWLDDVIDLFYRLREPGVKLRKKPATAELLDWLAAMSGFPEVTDRRERVMRTISSLVKAEDDLPRATTVINQWTQKQAS